ncbi:hypothetical protein MMC11_002373 [Xylographa trunciseda]|nr:hypothetical protein [Xylographa trunciseda]
MVDQDEEDENGASRLLHNRLSESRSPYNNTEQVRGHMNNPVAWQMWNPESLALAKQHNRLLFVSIGYAACHWCHVMERESFLAPEVAHILNSSFIPIKIDREERPDIDAIYMNYVQATTGSGGWPLNVFLTPDLEPVFGGTYWPGPNSSMALAGDSVTFIDILEKLQDVWQTQEEKCRSNAKQITQELKEFAEEGIHGLQLGEKAEGEGLEIELLEEAYKHFEKQYDRFSGGLGLAPKFPTPVKLTFLLRLGQWPEAVKDIVGEEECNNAAAMAINTLRKMARGGIRDQLGYGFARYSVTDDWSLPHFEKMLYDQAQLLDVYLDAFLLTHDPEMLGAVCDIATYLTSPPIAAPHGGFYSAEDADSYPTHADKEKREGAYYVWTLKELRTVLGERHAEICAHFYGVQAHGNVAPENDPHDEFISQNVLKIATTPGALAKTLGMAESKVVSVLKNGRQKLREHRERERPRPALDDKIVVAWNGLAIGALARASSVLADIDPAKSQACLAAASSAVAFIQKELFDAPTGTLWRIYREGRGDTPGFADDYAFLIQGLIELYEATFDDAHLRFADTLQATQISLFSAPTGGFYTSAHPALTPSPPSPSTSSPSTSSPTTTTSDLLLRLKPGMDGAEPSANACSALNLHRLAALLAHAPYAAAARATVLAFEAEVEQWPFTYPGMLASVVLGRLGVTAVVLVGGESDDEREQSEREYSEGQYSEGQHKRDRSVGPGAAQVLRQLRGELRPARTVVRLPRTGGWLRERNGLVRELRVAAEGAGVRVLVCERGACRGWRGGDGE